MQPLRSPTVTKIATGPIISNVYLNCVGFVTIRLVRVTMSVVVWLIEDIVIYHMLSTTSYYYLFISDHMFVIINQFDL